MGEYGLTQFLSEWATPSLSPLGWGRDRMTYHRGSDEGEIAFLYFQKSDSSTANRLLFYINVGVASRLFQAYLAWPDSPDATRKLKFMDGLYRTRVYAAPELDFVGGRWLVDTTSAAAIEGAGSAVADAISEPWISELSSRSGILERLRSDKAANRAEILEVLWAADDGDWGQAHRLLLDATDKPFYTKLSEWISAMQRAAL